MSLSRIAREFAAEISSTDWEDAPYRLDRAGHRRASDSAKRRVANPLSADEADHVRTNVMWMAAQVLKHADPNLDVDEFATACGVPRSITHRTDGTRSGTITQGLRWQWETDQTLAAPPGLPLWSVQMICEVANLVVFKRQLAQVSGFDHSEPPAVVPLGGSTRQVTVLVRDWDEPTAVARALSLVSSASMSVLGGGPATLVSVVPLGHEG